MRLRSVVRTSLLNLVLAACATNSFAAWPPDPASGAVAVAVTATSQLNAPVAISDGMSGVFIVWHGTATNDIFMQRINAAGNPMWAANGIIVCNSPGSQLFPAIVSDGAGGVIAAWTDARNAGVNDIYAQRVNGSGVVQWATNGVPVCTAASDQMGVQMVADGAGGAILTWRDFRAGLAVDIYAQRINASGATQWAASGLALSTAPNEQDFPVITSDGAGGAIVCWEDQRAGVGQYDIYGQRVNAAGATQWIANGLAICNQAGNQITPRIASDALGGAIIVWADYRGASGDIYASRVSPTGGSYWSAGGIAVCTATGEQTYPGIAADGNGGALVAWSDARGATQYDIYAQRLNSSGVGAWTTNGVALSVAAQHQVYPSIISDGAQGAIVAWLDFRTGGNSDIHAQRVSGSGVVAWTTDGVPVSTAYGAQNSHTIASDGAGGAILAWADPRMDTHQDIYAQRVDHFGPLGSPEPMIVNVRDVPGDQGGKVSIFWDASYVEAEPWNLVSTYWIWRQAPRAVAFAALEGGGRLEDDAMPGGVVSRGLWKVTQNGAQAYYWELLSAIQAHGFGGYSYVAPTTSDSMASGNPRTLFMVEARGSGFAKWMSAPDSGYSVDNIPPATPAPFAGQYAAGTSTLHWGVNGEADFAEYRLHRGNFAGFVPGPGNLVAAQPDTGYVDPAGSLLFYKLAAVDVHGNISGYAVLLPQGTVGVGDEALPVMLDLSLLGNNPVRQGTAFRYALPTAGSVRVSLFDQQGREVRTLADGAAQAGVHRAAWDGRDEAGNRVPSGIYFCRLVVAGASRSVKVAVVR